MTPEKQAALAVIQSINAVEGFDPTPLAVEYTDLNTMEKRLKLPVSIQIGWFWKRYPEGRIAATVVQENDCFVATARIYPHYSAPADHYLAEATASRGYLADKPEIRPREWAQTAAIGAALRYAGFGLQFGAASDVFDSPTIDGLQSVVWSGEDMPQDSTSPDKTISGEQSTNATPSEATQENPLLRAMNTPCPISKYSGKTLGQVLQEDQNAILWVANKFKGNPEISAAAKLICEHAVEQSA